MPGMDMLEHEDAQTALGAIASRSNLNVFTIGQGAVVLPRSFLVKRMEIQYVIQPHAETAISGIDTDRILLVNLTNTSAGTDRDSLDEVLGASLDDPAKHKLMVWSRMHLYRPIVVSDAEDEVVFPQPIEVKTSKSFPKGFPLDKDEVYTWRVSNLGGNAISTGAFISLMVRYWGVWL